MLKSLLVWATLATALSAQYPDVLYLKFNEGSGRNVINWANTAATPVFESGVGGVWTGGQPGFNGAMDFAALDRLLTGYITNLNTSFTIECWFRVNAPLVVTGTCASGACPLGRLWGDYSGGLSLFRCYLGFYNVGVNHLGGGFNGTYAVPAGQGLRASPANVLDGLWHHAALVFDQTAQTLTSYVDGNLDQQATGVTTGAAPATANFCVGGQQTTADRFNGAIDEFRWWSTPLSQAQIQANMIGELPETQLKARFAADEVSGPAHHVVRFTNYSVTPDLGGITSYFWDFGDGANSTSQNACHIYTVPGVYTVSLTITDAMGTTTQTRSNYINVGPQAMVVGSCGLADLYMAAPPAPLVWFDGFTLLSTNVAAPRGSGFFFGLWPDNFTWTGVSLPASPGDPFHFLNVGNPALYPESPLYFPPGSLPGLVGITLDCVVVYRDAFGILTSFTTVSRVTI